jgi:hypothetical protein
MASTAQLRKIFAPILAANPGLVLSGRWLFRPPITHAIIGIFIDRTSSAACSSMMLMVLPLSRAESPSVLSCYRVFDVELVIGAPAVPWVQGKPFPPPRFAVDMFAPGYQARLVENFQVKAQAFFDQPWQLADITAWLQNFTLSGWGTGRPEVQQAWILFMDGNFTEAADTLDASFQRATSGRRGIEPSHLQTMQDAIAVLRTGDSAHIARHFHDLEAATVAYHRLGRYWQPTPFPFEPPGTVIGPFPEVLPPGRRASS